MNSGRSLRTDVSTENNYFKFNLDNPTKFDTMSLKLVCPIDCRQLEMTSDFSDFEGKESSLNVESDVETNNRQIMIA
jgi:hypothetical protein